MQEDSRGHQAHTGRQQRGPSHVGALWASEEKLYREEQMVWFKSRVSSGNLFNFRNPTFLIWEIEINLNSLRRED